VQTPVDIRVGAEQFACNIDLVGIGVRWNVATADRAQLSLQLEIGFY
jgi:hypothetical protein